MEKLLKEWIKLNSNHLKDLIDFKEEVGIWVLKLSCDILSKNKTKKCNENSKIIDSFDEDVIFHK